MHTAVSAFDVALSQIFVFICIKYFLSWVNAVCGADQ